jgi:hypothetical protein
MACAGKACAHVKQRLHTPQAEGADRSVMLQKLHNRKMFSDKVLSNRTEVQHPSRHAICIHAVAIGGQLFGLTRFARSVRL